MSANAFRTPSKNFLADQPPLSYSFYCAPRFGAVERASSTRDPLSPQTLVETASTRRSLFFPFLIRIQPVMRLQGAELNTIIYFTSFTGVAPANRSTAPNLGGGWWVAFLLHQQPEPTMTLSFLQCLIHCLTELAPFGVVRG